MIEGMKNDAKSEVVLNTTRFPTIWLPGTCLSSILVIEPSKRRPFPIKTRVVKGFQVFFVIRFRMNSEDGIHLQGQGPHPKAGMHIFPEKSVISQETQKSSLTGWCFSPQVG